MSLQSPDTVTAESSPNVHGIEAIPGGIGAVAGVKTAGIHVGIKAKANPKKRDLALIVVPEGYVAASQITTNEVKAAPLLVSEDHLRSNGDAIRAIVANSGCANACTGERGIADARAITAAAAAALNVAPDSVLMASTGVIGVPLPVEKMIAALPNAVAALAPGPAVSAALAIMTTDTREKLSAYRFSENGRDYVVGGIAKGSGMISPSMATMLAFVATDYPRSRPALTTALHAATDDSFNMISVDGDMSTNDCIYAFAPAGNDLPAPAFDAALAAVCRDLAFAMVQDGEGATRTLTARVTGAVSNSQARTVARAIINSNLVRTALFGGDPNWGRIVAAAGSCGAGLVDGAWSLSIGGREWVAVGSTEVLSETEAHDLVTQPSVEICLDLGLGQAEAVGYGCDLSHGYVDINAHYRT